MSDDDHKVQHEICCNVRMTQHGVLPAKVRSEIPPPQPCVPSIPFEQFGSTLFKAKVSDSGSSRLCYLLEWTEVRCCGSQSKFLTREPRVPLRTPPWPSHLSPASHFPECGSVCSNMSLVVGWGGKTQKARSAKIKKRYVPLMSLEASNGYQVRYDT